MDVVIGANLAAARKWRAHHASSIPELADARLVSAYSHGWAHLNGVPVHRIYVAPGADKAPDFDRTLTTARWRQRKSHTPSEPIYLSADA